MKRIIKRSARIFGPYIPIIIILIILIIIFKHRLSILFVNPEIIRNYISGFGMLGPYILIFLMILQVFFFFIPGIIIITSAGYLFGIYWGTIYSWIGLMIGSILVFIIVRKLGRPFVERVIKEESLKEFDNFFTDRVVLALLISRTIPIGFPSDLASFAVALTPISFSAYFFVTAIGYLIHILIIASFGNQIANGFSFQNILLFSMIGFILLFIVMWKPIKEYLEHKRHKREEYQFARGNLAQTLIDNVIP